jgi:hypothetical protein
VKKGISLPAFNSPFTPHHSLFNSFDNRQQIAMNFSNIFATLSLTATQTPERTNTSGTTTLGLRSLKTKFIEGDSIMVVRKFRSFGIGSIGLVEDTGGGVVCSATTAYVAAVPQVETAAAAGTITLAGNATVTVTAAGLTGSPLAISVPVLLSDTASAWAAKVRTALTNNAAIASRYTVGGTGTAIWLTRILADEYGYSNDATLNIALANGTCTGITAAPTSTNATAGALATGGYWDVTANEDGEGIALPVFTEMKALLIYCTKGTGYYIFGAAEQYKGDLVGEGAIGFHQTPPSLNLISPLTGHDVTVDGLTAGINEFIVVLVYGNLS